MKAQRNRGSLEGEGWKLWGRVAISPELAEELKLERIKREIEETSPASFDDMAEHDEPPVEPDRPMFPDGQANAKDPLGDWSGPRLQIFSREDLEKDKASQDTWGHDQETRKRKSALHKLLQDRGPDRRLATLPDDWRQKLNELDARFPNFAEVVDYLRAMFSMAELGDRSPRLDPFLLNGAPGIGKSFFAENLNGLLMSGYRRINMENAQTSAQLNGSDEFWANSKVGAVFETLVEGDWANPILLLDEVDKVSGGLGYDPMGALYGLLEPSTARTFRDLSVPRIALDASRIYWILTSNEIESIPAPIRSRVRHFEIAAPTIDQSLVILNQIYQTIQVEIGLEASLEPLSEEVTSMLVRAAPRRQRQILREAIGRAIYSGRRQIVGGDVRLPSDMVAGNRRIGF